MAINTNNINKTGTPYKTYENVGESNVEIIDDITTGN